MILYNLRYRGPYEYDKFVLNIFQTYNETKRLLNKFEDDSVSKVAAMEDTIDSYIEALCSEEGTLQNILLMKLATE